MEGQEEKIRNDRRFNRWFRRKLIAYFGVGAFLALINALTTPHNWWVVWVVAGWGLHLLLHALEHLADCDDTRNYDNH